MPDTALERALVLSSDTADVSGAAADDRYDAWHVRGTLPTGTALHLNVGACLVEQVATASNVALTRAFVKTEMRLVEAIVAAADDRNVVRTALRLLEGATLHPKQRTVQLPWHVAPWLPRNGHFTVQASIPDLRRALVAHANAQMTVVEQLSSRSTETPSAPRQRAAGSARASTAPHPTLSVSPVQVDLDATGKWCEQLRTAASESEPPTDEALRSVAQRTKGSWQVRLKNESKTVEAFLKGVDEHGMLHGTLRDNTVTGSRLSVYYHAAGRCDIFKSVAPATRHITTGHKLLELDISGAHPAVAWSAVMAKHGDQAARVCPHLDRLANDREQLVQDLVASGYFDNAKDGKIALLAALNQDAHHIAPLGCFRNALRRERARIFTALQAFPALQAQRDAIAAKAGGDMTRHLSLFLQAGETKVLEAAIPALGEKGWHVAAPIGDALLLQAGENPCSHETAQVLFQDAARGIGCEMIVKVDHVPCA